MCYNELKFWRFYEKIYILGGGTFNYVRNHLALAAPAFGKLQES